jgi:hypothetical protein
MGKGVWRGGEGSSFGDKLRSSTAFRITSAGVIIKTNTLGIFLGASLNKSLIIFSIIYILVRDLQVFRKFATAYWDWVYVDDHKESAAKATPERAPDTGAGRKRKWGNESRAAPCSTSSKKPRVVVKDVVIQSLI